MRYQNENFNGEYDFRCRIHYGWKINANLHEYSELLYCKKGTGSVTVNGTAVPIRDGQLVWIPPNYVHQYDCENAEVVCAVFSNDLIPLFFKVQAGRYFCVSAVETEELASVLDGFYKLKKEDFCTVSGYLNLICAKVLRQSKFDSGRHNDGVLYQKVISYISEHYTEDITLSGVAAIFGYNEKYLSHTLHDLTGIHFRQLLAFYRVGHAKKLLTADVNQDITSIAMDSGFSAINSFHRIFKEMTGMTPSQYRKTYSL